jgi:hypothetical protein
VSSPSGYYNNRGFFTGRGRGYRGRGRGSYFNNQKNEVVKEESGEGVDKEGIKKDEDGDKNEEGFRGRGWRGWSFYLFLVFYMINF